MKLRKLLNFSSRSNSYKLKTVAFFVCSMFFIWNASAQNSLEKKVTLSVKKELLKNVFQTIKEQTGVYFVYNDDLLSGTKPVTINVKNESIKDVLELALLDQALTYKFEDNYVIISKEDQQQPDKVIIKGTVLDGKTSEVIPGVNVYASGTFGGGISDFDGNFEISVSGNAKKIVFSFIGYEAKEVDISEFTKKSVTIYLETKDEGLDEVVVNGFFEQSKSSNTGSVTSIKSEDLLEVSNTNVFDALVTLTPGMYMVEQPAMGSNPNHIPELVIRGTTSLASEGEQGLNAPLIVIDGVEANMQMLYDMDINDIERADILKDASATALYGERAANGVIVIQRKKNTTKEVRARYNFVPKMQFADLTSFDFTNAEEKLEFERLAGLYESSDGRYDQTYLNKHQTVSKGGDYDWMAQPIRNAYSFTHSLAVSGGGEKMFYGINGNFNQQYGVMKGDHRYNYGLGFNFNYRLNDKLSLNWRTNIMQTNSKDSPYGRFSNYVQMNPYTPFTNAQGEYDQYIYFYHNGETQGETINPLYDAMNTSSFEKSKSKSIQNSLAGRWTVNDNFFVTGNINYTVGDSRSDNFTSPNSVDFYETAYGQPKGRYSINGGESNTIGGQVVGNYNFRFGSKGTILSLRGGANYNSSSDRGFGVVGVGFAKDRLNDLGFASEYPQSGQPVGEESRDVTIGWFGNVNYSFRNRYFADVNYRVSGSSQFGKNNRYAPFWSLGGGYNIHNENWFRVSWVNILRLRLSLGVTGSVNFPSYMSLTTYEYDNRYSYHYSLGALPITLGNPDLTWQTTYDYNVGMNASLFKNRLDLQFNYYEQHTKDMLIALSLPPSNGIRNAKTNLGEMKNWGYEYSLSGVVIKKKDLMWRLTINGGYNGNTITKLSDALRSQNESANASSTGSDAPVVLFNEGESSSAIYTVMSAGIDPATGQEIFITRNGDYTFDYNPQDKVAYGDTNPLLRGAMTSNLKYKGFTLMLATSYTYGGEIYNGTLANKVEYVNPRQNVDRRAYSERWKQPGDVTAFRGIPEFNNTKFHSSRYVQTKNEIHLSRINLAYDFKPGALSKIGFKKLRLGFGLNDIARLSTVKFERGTSYPFARSFDFTFSPTF